MLLTRGVSNTSSVLLVFDTWEKIIYIWEILTHVLHISHHFSTSNNRHLHFSIYYKYMMNLHWGLGFEVTIFTLLHIKWHELPLHMIFLCYSKCVLDHTFNIYTFFSHHCDLILCKWKIYHVFNTLYVDYKNYVSIHWMKNLKGKDIPITLNPNWDHANFKIYFFNKTY
jgi:hypothetical protein